MGYVYLVRNLLNGKGYVGKTKGSLLCRQIGHLRDAIKGSKFLLHRALRKYGPDAFEWKMLMCSDDLGDLNESEIVMIKALRTRSPSGYNLTDGGTGGDTFSGRCHSEEAKEKIRKTKTPEIIKRVADFHRGRKRSLKTRLAISRATTGRTAWNKGKKGKKTGRSSWNKGLPAWNKGKFPSEETRAKMSDSAKKRFEEKSPSEETRAKMSDSAKKRYTLKRKKRDVYGRFLLKEKTVA